MVKGKWLIAAALALSTTGCIESMDGSYTGDAYGSDGYYARPRYYSAAPVTYYQPTQVVTQTRYVPVAVPVAVPVSQPQRAPEREHRWAERRDGTSGGGSEHHAAAPAQTHPQTQTQQTQQQPRRRDRDRDGDGRPDRRS